MPRQGRCPAPAPVAGPTAIVWERDPSVPDDANALAGREASLEATSPKF
jgi:hypothetical protein